MERGTPARSSTQRIAVRREGDDFALLTWPGELKDPGGQPCIPSDRRSSGYWNSSPSDEDWSGDPTPHLAFRFSTPEQRLYMHCRLDLDEYVHRWSGEDLEHVHAYAPQDVRGELWPWLGARGYASAEDGQWLDDYLETLGRRDAHLRPGIEARRRWPWAEAIELDDRGLLTAEIRDAATARPYCIARASASLV